MTTSVTLADIATRIDMLEIRCSRCDRTGRRRVSRLIEQHGGSMRLGQRCESVSLPEEYWASRPERS